MQVDENGVRAQLQPTHQFDSIAERCSPTSAPGLAPHLRRDSVRHAEAGPIRSEAPSRAVGSCVRVRGGAAGSSGTSRPTWTCSSTNRRSGTISSARTASTLTEGEWSRRLTTPPASTSRQCARVPTAGRRSQRCINAVLLRAESRSRRSRTSSSPTLMTVPPARAGHGRSAPSLSRFFALPIQCYRPSVALRQTLHLQ